MKTCTKCGIEKELGEYYNSSSNKSTGKKPRCKKCMNEVHSRWVEKNRDIINKRQAEYNKNNRSLIAKRNRERYKKFSKDDVWYANYLKVGRINSRKHMDKLLAKQKASVECLDDGYVKQQIIKNTNLSRKDIPQELVELKRIQLKLHREIKNEN